MKNNNKIFVIIGPSGVGKDTMIKKIPFNQRPMGFTTRKPRQDDENLMYFTEDKVNKIVKENKAIYTINFNNHRYGFLKSEFDNKLKNGNIFIIINLESLKKIQKIYSNNIIPIFLTASKEKIIEHMKYRRDKKENIKERIKLFEKENSQLKEVKNMDNSIIINVDNLNKKQLQNKLDEIISSYK